MVEDETTRAIYPTVEEIEDAISEAVSVILQSGQEPNDPAVIAALAAKAAVLQKALNLVLGKNVGNLLN